MFKQTEEKYRKITLGNGSGSLYDFGCYLFSLVNGLIDFDWDYTPEYFNQLLRDKKALIGEFNNYINVDLLYNILPDIFVSFKQIDVWPGFPVIEDYLSKNYIIIGKVDARGIGGSGSHFVRVIDTIENKNTVIQDPWTGATELVTNRYNKYNNILSLRIFEVKRKKNTTMPDETQILNLLKKYNLEVKEDKTLENRIKELDIKINEHVGTDWGGGQHSGYLGAARYEISQFKESIRILEEEDVKQEEIRKTKEETDTQRLTTLAKNLDTPYMISDKEKSWNEILGKSANYKATELSRDEYKDKYDREVIARKADYVKYQQELTDLKIEIEKMQRQLDNINLRVEDKIEEGTKIEEKLPTEITITKETLWAKFINWFQGK
jgi:hypothetical protein